MALDTSMLAPSAASERTVQSMAGALALKTIRPALRTRHRAERAGSGFFQAMHRFRPLPPMELKNLWLFGHIGGVI